MPGAHRTQAPSAAEVETTVSELAEARDNDPQWLKWLEREREARARSEAQQQLFAMGPNARARQTIADLALRAQAADAIPSDSCPTDGVPDLLPVPLLSPAVAPPAGSPRLPRREWLKRELAAEQLAARVDRRARAKVRASNNLPEGAAEWGPERERDLVQARAKVRARVIEGRVSDARAYYAELSKDPELCHFAIAVKKICDECGWTLADVAAQRSLAAIAFLLELARPQCWNARYARPPSRGVSKLGRSFATRKYSPCVRAVSQQFLATVLAWRGHTDEDDRGVDRSTVRAHFDRLERHGVVQVVQVPQHAAEPHEIGTSGHVINRYWLASRGSPKPALLSCWTLDGALVDVDVLLAPWVGAKPAIANANAPP